MKSIKGKELKILAEVIASSSTSIDVVCSKLSFYEDALTLQSARLLLMRKIGARSLQKKGFYQCLEDRVEQCLKELNEISKRQ